jgi:hypothetical protein
MVKRLANTLRRTVLLINTNEMNNRRAIKIPRMKEILLRLALRASTRER